LCCGEELLPKHYAEAERVSLFKALSTLSLSCSRQGAKDGFVPKKEEASGARRVPWQHIWKRGQRPQRPSGQLTGKRKANELASSRESLEPANRRPALEHGFTPLPASAPAVTGEQAATCSRQLGSPEGGATYAAVLVGPVAPSQPSGPLMPTAMGSDTSEPAVSSETENRRLSSDKSGPLSGMPVGTTPNDQVTNTCLTAGERPNETAIFISCVSDTRSFLASLRAFCPGGLTAQLKGEKLMVVPSTAEGFRAMVSALRAFNGGKV
jgi:hypothetical protein